MTLYDPKVTRRDDATGHLAPCTFSIEPPSHTQNNDDRSRQELLLGSSTGQGRARPKDTLAATSDSLFGRVTGYSGTREVQDETN